MDEYAISSSPNQEENLNNNYIIFSEGLFQDDHHIQKDINCESEFYYYLYSEENSINNYQPIQEENPNNYLQQGREENSINNHQPIQEENPNNNKQQSQEESKNNILKTIQEKSLNNNLQQAQEETQKNNSPSAQEQKSINNFQSSLIKDIQSAQELKPNNFSQSTQETGLNNKNKLDKEESSINYSQLAQKKKINSALTEVGPKNEKYNSSINNEEEVVDENYNIPNQNNKKILFLLELINVEQINYSTKLTQKKRGRKEIDSTEIGGHTKNAKDNLRKKNWRLIIKSFLNLLNAISSPHKIKLTNFEIQFCNNIIDNEAFLDIKIYKYFLFDKNYKKYSYYNLENNKNYRTIYKMVCEKKNQLYCAIMASTIGEMYEKFKNNEKFIIFKGICYELPNFKTFSDFEKENQIGEKQLNILKTLVDYIKKDGPKIKRKKESTRNIDYVSTPELDKQLNS